MSDNKVKKNLEEWLELWRLTDAAYAVLLKRWDLSWNSYSVLKLLSQTPAGVEPAVIADTVNIMRQLVTIILNDLEKKKMIVRKELKTDHRRKKIILSAHGKLFAENVVRAINEIELESISQMSLEEQEQLVELSARYYKVIQKAVAENNREKECRHLFHP